MTIANIRALCKERKITIAELERNTGLGNGVIARWDGASPRIEGVKAVADYFGVSVDDLLREEATQGEKE